MNPEIQDVLRSRTKQFALRVLKLSEALGKRPGEGWTLRNQILRSATSVGANYRAACRARSIDEFAAKISIVIEETDETIFWLELLVEASFFPKSTLQPLLEEATELLKIFVAARRTTRAKINARNSKSEIRN